MTDSELGAVARWPRFRGLVRMGGAGAAWRSVDQGDVWRGDLTVMVLVRVVGSRRLERFEDGVRRRPGTGAKVGGTLGGCGWR